MPTEYLAKRESPMLNSLRYGTSPYLPLDVEQVLETKLIRKGMEAQYERLGESLLQLRDMDDDLRHSNRSLERIGATTGVMADELRSQRGSLEAMATGIGALDSSVRAGLTDMSDQLMQLGYGMEDGFTGLAEELQSGFEAVVTSLAIIDERLGQRLAAHFEDLQTQLAEQHDETLNVLSEGFEQVSQAVLLSAEYLGHAITAAAEAQMRQVAQEGEATRRLIAETSQRHAEKLEEIRHAVVHQDAHRAEEHFMVGLNDFNHGDLRRAYLNFRKAERIYAGHFPTLFLLGFTQYLLNRLKTALQYFQAALSQADADNPAQAARQRGLAALYIARIYFTAKNFKTARIWYAKAFQYDPHCVMTALVEAATARLLAPDDKPETIVRAIKDDFKEHGQAAQYQYWYALALTLTPLDAEWAVAAFQQGIALDPDGSARRNRKRVLAMLRRLNVRHVDALLQLVKDEYPWLA